MHLFWSRIGSNGLKMSVLGQIWQFWGQKSIFLYSDCDITTLPRATTFPFGPPQTKNSVSELGVIFRGSPLFLALLGHSHVRGISTLNFGPISTKLGGTVQAIKK